MDINSIKDFNDICIIANIDINTFIIPEGSSDEEISDNAYNKLKLIVKVLNNGWKPNWGDDFQYKHYPYFKYDKGIKRFICYKYGSYSISPVVGSRLVFKSKLLAEFVVDKFIDIYNEYLSY